MPIYDYICENCDHQLNDIQQSIKDKPLKKCPQCGKLKLERVIYGGCHVSVRNTTTIGQLADKNFKKLSKYKKFIKKLYLYGESSFLIHNQLKDYIKTEIYSNLKIIHMM